ncbi:MAG: ORF6N domain-containing protein [Flavobacteriales bacterium]|nr:ORF6N domain-containing protein [Flavobacteriales bacterium]
MSTSDGNREEAVLADPEITGRILFIRGQRVMLDRDLAELYGMLPFRLREQVKRNVERFPRSFMFQLTAKELREVVSQFAIPSHTYAGGSVPYAFTEHGVLMLANVLRSERAVQMSIRIIELFVRMREMVFTHQDILHKLERIEAKVAAHDEDIGTLFDHIREMLTPAQEQPRQRIGYKQDKR